MRFVLALCLGWVPMVWAASCPLSLPVSELALLAQSSAPREGQGLRLPLRMDPRLRLEPPLAGETPSYLSSRNLEGMVDDAIALIGNAEVRQLGLSLKADRIDLDLVQNALAAQGGVQLFRQGEFYRGPRLSLRLGTQQGQFSQVDYEFAAMNARGYAEQIDFVQPKEIALSDVTFTTCPVDRPAWQLRSRFMRVDQVREIVDTESTVLYWSDVPLLSLGSFSFPSSSRRKTGFLNPSYGYTSRLGLELSTPFYWNIAPNRDLTLYPRLVGRRGVMLGAEARYLTRSDSGTVGLEFLPNDRVANADRHLVSLTHSRRFGANAALSLRGSRVSDDDYFADFGESLLVASQRILPATATLTGVVGGWATAASVQTYQVLQDIAAPIVAPYSWMPRFQMNNSARAVRVSKVLPATDWRGLVDVTRFSHPTLAEGTRVVAATSVSMPLDLGYFGVTPKLGIHATHYSHERSGRLDETRSRFFNNAAVSVATLGTLANNVQPGMRSYSRVLPTFSLDVNTILERDTFWGNLPATQTIEPRVLYTYTPYKDQSRFPVFDSARPSISLAQILSDQTFTGQDRVADQNHLTTAVTSRMLDAQTGQELARASVAQRFYIGNQLVTLPGEPVRTQQESDVFAEGGVSLYQHWRVDAVGQYAIALSRWQAASARLRFDPRPGYSAALSYRFNRDTLDIVDLAFQVPIARNWYAVGRYNYSFQREPTAAGGQRGLVEALAGLEYDGGCWVARTVIQRFATGANRFNNAIFLQIELNGIARVGTDPLDALRRSIPNYRMINRLSPMPAKFDNFQ
ncbi:MAG: LPS-assembly protein LptD [Betaproteobacteria bacterium]|nr:LPS-assembly protein LptD [Betaproteobacteria bacterium]